MIVVRQLLSRGCGHSASSWRTMLQARVDLVAPRESLASCWRADRLAVESLKPYSVW